MKNDIKKLFPEKWEETKQKAYKRDGRKCQFIKPNGKKCNNKKWLDPHHIIPKSHDMSSCFNSDNVITLCRYHHKIVTGNEHVYAQQFIKTVKENKNGK